MSIMTDSGFFVHNDNDRINKNGGLSQQCGQGILGEWVHWGC